MNTFKVLLNVFIMYIGPTDNAIFLKLNLCKYCIKYLILSMTNQAKFNLRVVFFNLI